MVAVRNFLPEDPALLAFHKGDIIHLQPLEPPRMGQRHGGGGGGVGTAGEAGAGAGEGASQRVLTQVRPSGYSAGCVVGKKVVYLEELRRRGPDFGRYPGTPVQLPQLPDLDTPNSGGTILGSGVPEGLAWLQLLRRPCSPGLCPHIWLKGLRGH